MPYAPIQSAEDAQMKPMMRAKLSRFTGIVLALTMFFAAVLPRSASAETKVTYLYNDAGGTSLAAADETGQVIWRRAYTPFGEEHEVNGDTVEATNDPRGYTGHTFDRNTGLIYMGARYYNPRLGLFYSRDPAPVDATDPITFNRYIYANQNPYAYVDPDGEFAFLIPVIWGVGAALTAYDTYQTYQNEGAKAAAKTLAVDGAITLLAGAAVKIGHRIFKGIKAGKAAAKADSAASGLPPLRQDYVDAVRGLADNIPGMREAGMTTEQIARALHAERRALGVQYKDLTPPDLLEQIYARNLEKYGDKLGPSIDYLVGQGKSWEQIIESATRSGGKDLGF